MEIGRALRTLVHQKDLNKSKVLEPLYSIAALFVLWENGFGDHNVTSKDDGHIYTYNQTKASKQGTVWRSGLHSDS